MPDPQTDLQEILNQDLSEWTIKVCLAAEVVGETTHEFQILQITDALTREFMGLVEANLAKVGEKHPSAYSPGSRVGAHELEYVDLAAPEFQLVNDQLGAFPDLENMLNFSADTKFTKRLRFYVIIAERAKHEPIYFFRQYTKAKELRRSAIFGAIMQNGQFDTTREPLFLFDSSIDCFKQGDNLYLLNKARFEQIFRIYRQMNEKALTTLDKLEGRAVIANFGAFREDCEKHHFAKRELADLSEETYIQELTIDRAETQLQETPELTIKIENGQIVYRSEDIWQLLRFLRGYYYRSSITQRSHEATGSRTL